MKVLRCKRTEGFCVKRTIDCRRVDNPLCFQLTLVLEFLQVCHSDSPPGSTAAHPLWFLRSSWFRMGRAPNGRSECWRACWAFRRTSPPVARPRRTPCLHWLLAPAERQRERERWGLKPSVITAPIKAGEYCGRQTWDTVCPLAFSHKLRYEPDTGACCEVWTHEADSTAMDNWTN